VFVEIIFLKYLVPKPTYRNLDATYFEEDARHCCKASPWVGHKGTCFSV